MGKTESGAVWLDASKTSPYDFYQYWRNVADSDVIKCLKMLTFLPLEEIEAMEKWQGSELNKAKEILAFELTQLVHGTEEANKAMESAKALFAGGSNSENMPKTVLTDDNFTDGNIDILTLLVTAGMTSSKSEARRAVEQGGVSVNGEKVTDTKAVYTKDTFNEEFILKKGKKNFQRILNS
jgi:tyrosyl-tRNA synthetase